MTLRSGQAVLLLLLCFGKLQSQTVYYPAQSSDICRSTAQDIAALFTKAINGSSIGTQSYNSIPSNGIIFVYDPSVTINQACRIESDGKNYIRFSASGDNGLSFGIYTYLNSLGFRFYLPGDIWEMIPSLNSPYRLMDQVVAGKFKYNNWFISGGYNRWVMDNIDFGLDNYAGFNGHEWSKYQRRNNMLGEYRFDGHRGDIMDADYLSFLKANPCFVACNNGSRLINSQSVPDINNKDAKDKWASAIAQQYSLYQKNIFSNPGLYANYYYNFSFNHELIGIEAPDAGKWGNSTDNLGCATGNFNGEPYPAESDQQFLLANSTAEKVNATWPSKHFQCYAYSGHADVPSSSITINPNIDVQVIPSAFQFETSTKALLNRWYPRHSKISEYYYLNIPKWTGETPGLSFADLQNTLLRLKQKNSQGIVVEASPAKFASLPFLLASNNFLQNDINCDSTLDEFVFNMFPYEPGIHTRKLLKFWGDENVITNGNFTTENKYKIPLYLKELNEAILAAKNPDAKLTERLQELKAYLHYMVLYYDLISDPRSLDNKAGKAASVCLYLAATNRMQLVNSYYLILDLVNKFPPASEFYRQYNVGNGTEYKDGKITLITSPEIDKNFSNDLAIYGNLVDNYSFEDPATVISKMSLNSLLPLDKIKVHTGYTNGYEYSNRSEFYFYAPSSGNISISCIPAFSNTKGFINLAVEADDKPLLILKDEKITASHDPGMIIVNIPSAGIYKLSVVSKYQSSADLTITTNGNIFFKKGPFYGDKTESYLSDNWASFPKYVHVPAGVNEIYFNINNSCYTSQCLSPDAVIKAFGMRLNGRGPEVVAAGDSSLYKIILPFNPGGNFLQINTMREYNLCFANISNIEIYAQQKPEGAALPVPQGGITVGPNPSHGVFDFRKGNLPYVFTAIKIYDGQGKIVLSSINSSSVDLSAMSSGIYFYVARKDGEISRGKLIKN